MLWLLLCLLVLTLAVCLPALVIPVREQRLADRLELDERAHAIRDNLRRVRADGIYRTLIS